MKNQGKILMLLLINFSQYIYMFSQDADVRISWDHNTYWEQTSVNVANKGYIENECYYPRIKKLKDGSFLMVFMNHKVGFDIFTRKSNDNGETWTDAVMVRQSYSAASSASRNDKMIFATPDFVELHDGSILLAYQWRYQKGYTDLENTNRNCGIEIMTSKDHGKTFSAPRIIYYGRCWEPSFLQLPSGEIQLYITDSNEVMNNLSQPCVSLLRSYDNGITWQNKEVTTFKDGEVLSRTIDERGSYDGMPSAQYLSGDNGIAMTVEVWSSKYQVDVTPVIVYSSLEKNWKYNDISREKGGPYSERKKQLHKSFRGFAPYIEKLPSGEILVQSNGVYNREQGMWVFIGNNKADNFSYASSPYDGYWGSIAYIGNNEVLSAGTFTYTVDGKTHSGIKMIKGKLNYPKLVNKEEIQLQSLVSFNERSNNYWFIGQGSPSSAYLDFGYNDSGFDFATYVFDRNLVAYTPNNSDALEFLLNRMDPVTGRNETYQLAVNAKGVFTLNKEKANSWIHQNMSEMKDITFNIEGTVNNESDKDLGFAAKVEIPWHLLGGIPAKDEVFRVHLRHRYKDTVNETPVAQIESVPGEDENYPESWLRISFDLQ